jgi:hypothetical protein
MTIIRPVQSFSGFGVWAHPIKRDRLGQICEPVEDLCLRVLISVAKNLTFMAKETEYEFLDKSGETLGLYDDLDHVSSNCDGLRRNVAGTREKKIAPQHFRFFSKTKAI